MLRILISNYYPCVRVRAEGYNEADTHWSSTNYLASYTITALAAEVVKEGYLSTIT